MTTHATGETPAYRSGLGMQDLIDLLAAAAHASRRGKGPAVDRLREVFEADGGTAGLSEDERHRAMLVLQQVALPGMGSATEGARAPDAAMADYLAARHAARMLRQDAGAIVAAVGDPRLATPVFERSLAREFQADPTLAKAVIAAAFSGDASGGDASGEAAEAFAFIRRLAARAAPPAAAPASRGGGGLFGLLLGRR